ncbi:MAG: hypothetical protein CME66_10085 [Halobacteriovoraceae bacterium]|jgi:pimeloyl-ACP methyl ester carboxylesterase|nr:hypothetical protein [Halobacteriovoraceae bacterium]
MVNTFFIPPMGHLSSFYQDYIQQYNSHYYFLDYPLSKQEQLTGASCLIKNADYFAQKIQQINQKTNQNEFMIIGVSLGATLSLKINEKLNNTANKLILIAPGGIKVTRARKELIKQTLNELNCMDFITKVLGLTSSDFLKSNFCQHFSVTTPTSQEYYQKLYSFWKNNNHLKTQENFKSLVIDALDVNYEELLERYQDKIHIIWSEKDKVFSSRHLKRFQHLCQKSIFSIYPNYGHYLPLEAPEELNKIVRSYVCHL